MTAGDALNAGRVAARGCGIGFRPRWDIVAGTPDETATFTEQGLAHLLTNTTTDNQTVSSTTLSAAAWPARISGRHWAKPRGVPPGSPRAPAIYSDTWQHLHSWLGSNCYPG
jgi:hypothetical protein